MKTKMGELFPYTKNMKILYVENDLITLDMILQPVSFENLFKAIEKILNKGI